MTKGEEVGKGGGGRSKQDINTKQEGKEKTESA